MQQKVQIAPGRPNPIEYLFQLSPHLGVTGQHELASKTNPPTVGSSRSRTSRHSGTSNVCQRVTNNHGFFVRQDDPDNDTGLGVLTAAALRRFASSSRTTSSHPSRV